MTTEPLELIRGSGNVYRDMGMPDADIRQLKAILAAGIIQWLERERLTARAAHALTGIDAADYSRIRNADFRRISIERLIDILNRAGTSVEVQVRLKRRRRKSATGAGAAIR